MLHRVSSQLRMIGLNVELKMIHQVILPEKVKTGRRIRVILMSGGLAGFRLNVELSGKSDLLGMVYCHVQQPGKVVEFALHVRIDQRGVTLSASPEYVSFTTQSVGRLKRVLYLACGIGKHIGTRRGSRSLSITRMRKKTGSSPEQFLPTAVLSPLQFFSDPLKI